MSAEPPIYRDRPQSLEPPVGRRSIRGPSALLLGLWIGLGLLAIALRLG